MLISFSSNARRQARRVALAALALASVSCASSAERPASGQAQTRAVFERNCAVCHGPRGEGTQLGTMKTPPLNSGAALTDTDELFFKQISDGGKGMPPFKHMLDDKQIEDLIRFIREELQGRK